MDTNAGTPTRLAGVRVADRILPVAFACFEYAAQEAVRQSRGKDLLLLINREGNMAFVVAGSPSPG